MPRTDEEIISEPYQLTLEEKDQLLLSLLDHLDLEAVRTSDDIVIRLK